MTIALEFDPEDPFAETETSFAEEENLMPVLSEQAAERVNFLTANEAQPGAMLRLKVLSGGCSGYQYQFDLVWSNNEQDYLTTTDQATLVVDQTSLPFLHGAVIDYVDELGGAYFKVTNPQAKSGCGCGTSFSL